MAGKVFLSFYTSFVTFLFKEVIDTSQQLSAFNVELGNGPPFIFGPTSVNYPEDTFEKSFANQSKCNRSKRDF